jgi:hypothetical protein
VLATEQPISTFYAAAVAALLGLLALLLVETQSSAKQLAASRSGVTPEFDVRRVPPGLLLPIIATLMAASIVAFRVLWRGHADPWEAILVWTALAIGLASIVLAAAIAFVTLNGGTALARRLRKARVWVPPILGLVAGLAASPLAFGGEHITGARFAVYGTCLSHGCGLKQRSGPGRQFREIDRRLRDGEMALVVCQAEGPAPPHVRSRIWDRLSNGHYVSDAFVNTPNRSGDLSEELRRC